MSTLEKRLEVLEASSGGDGGCERCRGLLVTVSHVTFLSRSYSARHLSRSGESTPIPSAGPAS